jgi:hypothetical protein
MLCDPDGGQHGGQPAAGGIALEHAGKIGESR